MKSFIERLKALVVEYDLHDYITPEIVAANEGGLSLLDANIKQELTKNFLHQALLNCEASFSIMYKLIEENLPEEKKSAMNVVCDEFFKVASDKKALVNFEQAVSEKFSSAAEKLYMSKKLDDMVRAMKKQ